MQQLSAHANMETSVLPGLGCLAGLIQGPGPSSCLFFFSSELKLSYWVINGLKAVVWIF